MNEAENGEAANDKKECIALKNIPGHGEDEAKTDEAQETGNKVWSPSLKKQPRELSNLTLSVTLLSHVPLIRGHLP